jgi:hypothetical protein
MQHKPAISKDIMHHETAKTNKKTSSRQKKKCQKRFAPKKKKRQKENTPTKNEIEGPHIVQPPTTIHSDVSPASSRCCLSHPPSGKQKKDRNQQTNNPTFARSYP